MAQCTAKTKGGNLCQVPVKDGQRFCHIHRRQSIFRVTISLTFIIGIILTGIAHLADIAGLLDYVGIKWPFSSELNTQNSPELQTVSQASLLGINEFIPDRKPETTIRVLFVKFDGEDQAQREISSEIKKTLKDNLEAEQQLQIEVIGTSRTITELEGSEIAVMVGELYQADIVIWGWYNVSEDKVPLIIHYEIIPSSNTFAASLCAASSSPPERIEKREALENLILQTSLANEFSYFTLFTLGLTYFENQEWETAASLFGDAIKYLPENSTLSANTVDHEQLVDEFVLFYYQGLALEGVGDYDNALITFQKLGEVWKGDSYYHLGTGKAYLGLKRNQEAIHHFTIAYDNRDSNDVGADALLYRATAYYRSGNFDWANEDLNSALKLSEMRVLNTIQPYNGLDHVSPSENELISPNLDSALTHFFRAFQVEETNPNQAIKGYSKAIEIYPKFLLAREFRAYLNLNKYDYTATKNDLLIAVQNEDFQTPCNYFLLGISYSRLSDHERAKEQFVKAVSKATSEIDVDETNGYAYLVRARANYELGKFYNALIDFWMVRKLDADEAKDIDLTSSIILSFFGIAFGPLVVVGVIVIILYLRKNYGKIQAAIHIKIHNK